jgi:hypothetical protein
MRLAIIGTAGRGTDGPQLASDPKTYIETMKRAALNVADRVGATTLISGGAAWADHIAVMLYLDHRDRFTLELELPSALGLCIPGQSIYEDDGSHNYVTNPGGTANYFHRRFTRASRSVYPHADSFMDLDSVRPSDHLLVSNRTKVAVTPGFLARNLIVAAKADHCLAMTFGNQRTLKDGGTAHTMTNFLVRGVGTAWHLDLNILKLYQNPIV